MVDVHSREASCPFEALPSHFPHSRAPQLCEMALDSPRDTSSFLLALRLSRMNASPDVNPEAFRGVIIG